MDENEFRTATYDEDEVKSNNFDVFQTPKIAIQSPAIYVPLLSNTSAFVMEANTSAFVMEANTDAFVIEANTAE